MEEKVLNGSISKEAQAAMIRKERTANNAWHKLPPQQVGRGGSDHHQSDDPHGRAGPGALPHDPNQINVLQTYLPPSPRVISWAPTTWGATSSAGSSTAPG